MIPWRPIRRLLPVLLGAMLFGACGSSPSVAPIDTTGPNSAEPVGTDASALPAGAVAEAIAADWRREPFDPREDDRVLLTEAICNAAGRQLPVSLDLVDARGENRVILVFATDPTSAAFECFADIEATKASEVQLFQIQDPTGQPIADAYVDAGHYGPASFGKIEAMVLVGRVGAAGAKVVAELADGTTVVATKRGGWYAMWWPGKVLASRVSAFDALGGVVASFTPRL